MATAKRNIVEGFAHMGQLVQVMPAIAAFIDAAYNQDEFLEAYETFMNADSNEPDASLNDADSKGIYWDHWILKGKELNFIIQFEKGEGYYFWHIRCPDENMYLDVKNFMADLFAGIE